MKFNQILLATITTLSLTLGSHINVAQAGLARGADLQIHRSIDNDDTPEIATSSERDRSMNECGLGWNAYKKEEHLNAIAHFYQAVEIDSENPYAFMGLAIVSGQTSQEGVVFMMKAAELFEQEGKQQERDLAIEWLQEAKSKSN
jgi:hypothetical protein